jgi:hypothetical protein
MVTGDDGDRDDDVDDDEPLVQDKGQDMWTQGVPNMPEQNYSSVHMNATDFFRRIHGAPEGAPAMACIDHFYVMCPRLHYSVVCVCVCGQGSTTTTMAG